MLWQAIGFVFQQLHQGNGTVHDEAAWILNVLNRDAEARREAEKAMEKLAEDLCLTNGWVKTVDQVTSLLAPLSSLMYDVSIDHIAEWLMTLEGDSGASHTTEDSTRFKMCESDQCQQLDGAIIGHGSAHRSGFGRCSKCKVVHYCRSTSCQRDHWSVHRGQCENLAALRSVYEIIQSEQHLISMIDDWSQPVTAPHVLLIQFEDWEHVRLFTRAILAKLGNIQNFLGLSRLTGNDEALMTKVRSLFLPLGTQRVALLCKGLVVPSHGRSILQSQELCSVGP